LVIAEGGSRTLHWMAELIAFSTKERTPAAEAVLQRRFYGTGEPVPLSKTGFFSGL
jgi:hypothetical protein